MERLKEVINETRRGKLTKGVLFPHDNTSVHNSHAALAALYKVIFEILNLPSYNPDLASSDFYLFPKLKKAQHGKKFMNYEVKNADRVKIFFFKADIKYLIYIKNVLVLLVNIFKRENNFEFLPSLISAPSYIQFILEH